MKNKSVLLTISRDHADCRARTRPDSALSGRTAARRWSDADTHHLLYVSGLGRGWFGVGNKRVVPKQAAYVAHYRGNFVWVMPENVETLTCLTLAIRALLVMTIKPPDTGRRCQFH